jgi:hypothetical protein
VAIASLALVLFALLGMFFIMTQYLQFCLGFSPLKTGLAIGPVALALLVVAPLSVVAARRVGTKPVVAAGLLLIALSLGLLSGTGVHDTYLDALPWFVLAGVGVGLTMAPCTESIMGSLPKEEAGVGSATSDTSMQVGGALGVGVLGTALTIRYQNFMTPLLAHLHLPAHINALILGSLGGALAVAQQAPGGTGQALATAATQGFISGMDIGLIIAAVIVGVAGLVVLALLPNRTQGRKHHHRDLGRRDEVGGNRSSVRGPYPACYEVNVLRIGHPFGAIRQKVTNR